jgi:glycosyltransferase involved in cell wall biosynthesis
MIPRKQHEMQGVLERYNINFPYFLFVGNIDPRKNLRSLMAAFRKFISKRKKNEKLILVGKRTSQADKELSVIDELGLHEEVLYLGYVPRGDLPALYANARIFVYPSFFEGFGFPVLEAMACGTPVITSNTSSLPEVCGDAAQYVIPGSVVSIEQALERVNSDHRLRKGMISRGLKRASRFKWERAASETIDCYKMILNRNQTMPDFRGSTYTVQ